MPNSGTPRGQHALDRRAPHRPPSPPGRRGRWTGTRRPAGGAGCPRRWTRPAPPSPGSRHRRGSAGCCVSRRNPPPRHDAAAPSCRPNPVRPGPARLGPMHRSGCRTPRAPDPSPPARARRAPARPVPPRRTARPPDGPARRWARRRRGCAGSERGYPRPAIPGTPCARSHASSPCVARQLAGSVTSCLTTSPRAAMPAASMSSGFAPTLPICGKVKVMICPANDGSVSVS